MADNREETYERIPWETLASPKADRQPLIIGLAASIVVGALVYSYVYNRPVEGPVEPVGVQTEPAAPSTSPVPVAPAPGPSTPEVIAEADLYAVAPDRLAMSAAGFAEWFVMEYFTSANGGDASVIRTMLASDIPVPTVPDGTVIFVEMVRALTVGDLDVGRHSVEVLVRYLVSDGGGPYQRMAPEIFTMEVATAGSGFQIVGAPEIRPAVVEDAPGPILGEVPADIAASAIATRDNAGVVGGSLSPDGSWRVVMTTIGPGGMERPETVVVWPAQADPPVTP